MSTRRRGDISPQAFRRLFREFAASSWAAWDAIEDAIFGSAPSDPDLVRRVTGRVVLPVAPVSEAWIIAGRGAGKSRFVARLAAFFACARTYPRAPGEQIYVGVFAPDRKQAAITFRYVVGLLRSVPALEQLIVAERRDSIELSTGVVIEVITASMAAPRGRAYALVVIEEAAFLPADDAADPDRELLRAVRPALARVPGSLLVVVSSPYAPRGELHRTWRERFAKDDDASVLVVQADTATLNPAFSQREIDRAYAEDEPAASAEYGAQFRRDIESFISAEVLEVVVVSGRIELPALDGVCYVAFTDPAGGSGLDSMTLAVTHAQDGLVVLDLLREVRPPFSPEATVEDFATVLRSYRVAAVQGDRYAGEWPREQFRKHGVDYDLSDKPKSDIYRDVLPLLNSGRVELLDHRRLRAQLASLERRVGRGGRDSIDHPPSGHDDVANAAAGALVLAHRATVRPRELEIIAAGGRTTYGDPLYQRFYEEALARMRAEREAQA